MFVLPCAIVALLSFYLSFLCFGQLVRTRSWPTLKGLDHPIVTSMLACFYDFILVLAFLVLGFATFYALSWYMDVRLHLTPMRPCLDKPFRMHRHDAGCFVHTFPSFRSVQWYACHACLCHSLAFYASIHDCLHVYAWVLLASVSFILQHNEAMNIGSKPTFVPSGQHLLFVSLFISLPTCWLAILALSHAMLAISILLVCFASFCFYLRIFLPFLVCWFSRLCLCMYTHEARMYGARAWSPRCEQKGNGCKLVNMS